LTADDMNDTIDIAAIMTFTASTRSACWVI